MTADKATNLIISRSEEKSINQTKQLELENESNSDGESSTDIPDFLYDSDSENDYDELDFQMPSSSTTNGTRLKAVLAPPIHSISDKGPGRLNNLGEYFRVFQHTVEGKPYYLFVTVLARRHSESSSLEFIKPRFRDCP